MAAHVTLIHRRDKLRAEKILQDRLLQREREGKVSFIWHHAVEEVLGDECGVNGVRLRSTLDGAAQRRSPSPACSSPSATRPTPRCSRASSTCSGGYISVRGGSDGYATATSVPGVFAAGDVADHVYRQAITSAGSGCMAALDADRYLEQLDSHAA